MGKVTRPKAIKILESRIEFLNGRVTTCLAAGVTPGYDCAEIAAIQLAIEALKYAVKNNIHTKSENTDAQVLGSQQRCCQP
jgi:hypothetical protein